MKRFSRRKLLAGLVTAPAALGAEAVGIEPTWLKVVHLRLNPNPSHRFVQITDIHHRGDIEYLQRVVDAINAQKPDFVCFTGDLVEESQYSAEGLAVLSKIRSPLYGIPGNHDFWADMDFDHARAVFAATGGRWLMDEEEEICKGAIRLIGITGRGGSAFSAKAGVKNILLSHYPSDIDAFRHTRFELILAGHSHGGQVRLPWYGAIIVPFGVGEYQLGLYETHAGPLYVSAGVGYFFLNVRFYCRPEITVFEV